jgi:uncharacterized protein involved in exopolysaccharide biosynthesis
VTAEGQAITLELVHLLVVLLRRRGLILVGILITALLVVAGGLAIRTYSARATFAPTTPQASGNLSSLAGLAQQFGVNVGDVTGPSPQFFIALATSRSVLDSAIRTTYRFPRERDGRDSVAMTLLEFFQIHEQSSADAILKAEKKLARAIDATADNATGIVTVEVRAPYPALAEQVAQELVDLTNDMNIRLQQAQSAAERGFAARQMEDAQARLYAAEDTLRRFMERNRDFELSPRLTFESGRLTRRVTLAQGVYTTLAQTYEQAAIASAQNTPVIRIIDSAHGSARLTPGIRRLVLVGLALGILVGIGLALVAEFLARQRDAHPAEFESLGEATRGALTVRRAAPGGR